MLGNFTYCNPTKLYFGVDSTVYEMIRPDTERKTVYRGGSLRRLHFKI